MSKKQKQVRSIFDAHILRGIDTERLVGSVFLGKLSVTSPIIHKEGNTIETENTIYHVINWTVTPDYLKDVPF